MKVESRPLPMPTRRSVFLELLSDEASADEYAGGNIENLAKSQLSVTAEDNLYLNSTPNDIPEENVWIKRWQVATEIFSTVQIIFKPTIKCDQKTEKPQEPNQMTLF